jgi:hypothetical protein
MESSALETAVILVRDPVACNLACDVLAAHGLRVVGIGDLASVAPERIALALVERRDWEDPSLDRLRAHLAWAGIEAPLVVVAHGRDDLIWRVDGIRCVVDVAELPGALDACVRDIVGERALRR